MAKCEGITLKQLFFSSVAVTCLCLITSCSSVVVPQIGAQAPCQIQSVTQVEQAVLSGLTSQHWEILSTSDHRVEARRKHSQMEAKIAVAYGYRGFSIEYQDSKNMDYDLEKDTIGAEYVKWAYSLQHAIEQVLVQEVKLSPPVKCTGKNTPT